VGWRGKRVEEVGEEGEGGWGGNSSYSRGQAGGRGEALEGKESAAKGEAKAQDLEAPLALKAGAGADECAMGRAADQCPCKRGPANLSCGQLQGQPWQW